ncbi:MAG: DUF2914 domain-containing protein [Acidobacteriota bacterium]|nr:MAG: DUF2914 domain-containing protein [Acidobacteriota bacterium]
MRVLPTTLLMTVLLVVPLWSQEGDAPEETTAITVDRIAACTGIEEREPVGSSDSFPADVGEVYCFTHIKGADGETTVTHVWYQGETERARVELNVRSASWRTWSKKKIPAEWAGSWRVVVVDESDNEIGSTSFTVGE